MESKLHATRVLACSLVPRGWDRFAGAAFASAQVSLGWLPFAVLVHLQQEWSFRPELIPDRYSPGIGRSPSDGVQARLLNGSERSTKCSAFPCRGRIFVSLALHRMSSHRSSKGLPNSQNYFLSTKKPTKTVIAPTKNRGRKQ